ncbi:hypothetical protein D187_005600 [Cystobacter fuscus DSM 2262]|uniref:Uncharacterized protein n=1 Tax=Cystobacter fuscus (strain ATCC 25194 / DSM 2262 / NBRC 100088 / M29) TaxID=1242864 RepID=S9P334_CYSF2|nr:hypothetical protein [Cystobacter fuscus]EPX57561.1 hypothetical protein D187_005600 [Cystobacter fuscus DSM 2262]
MGEQIDNAGERAVRHRRQLALLRQRHRVEEAQAHESLVELHPGYKVRGEIVTGQLRLYESVLAKLFDRVEG